MLDVLDRPPDILVGEPPLPPPANDDGDRGDKCRDCPVRQAMLQREADIMQAQKIADWQIAFMAIFGMGLSITPIDLERVQHVRMLTHLPCDGPQVGERRRPLAVGDRVVGRRVLRCSNVSVPEDVKQRHVEPIG